MNIKIAERDSFELCGYSRETCPANNEEDLNILFHDFFEDEQAKEIRAISLGGAEEYYGLLWYTDPTHQKYFYLLGQVVNAPKDIPHGATLKTIPKAQYAVCHCETGSDSIQIWTEFFYEAIPAMGYTPDYDHGFWFEYYPNGVSGKCELWSPVVKNHV